MEWQPISTAPRDGTPILTYGGKPDADSDEGPFPAIDVIWWNKNMGGWRHTSYDSGYYGEHFGATHWMHLPSPPKGE